MALEIYVYTMGSAYAEFAEGKKGSLAAGKLEMYGDQSTLGPHSR